MPVYEDDPFDDREDPDLSDQDRDDHEDAETIPCPYCNADVYEQAEVCPECGSYISRETACGRTTPRWVWVTAVLILTAIAAWIARGLR